MFDVAKEKSIITTFDRWSAQQPQCQFGYTGICCRICFQGPCRIKAEEGPGSMGICGAGPARSPPAIAARWPAAWPPTPTTAATCPLLLRRGQGEAAGYKVKDEQKLIAVAGDIGMQRRGKSNEIAHEVAEVALEQFGQPHGEIILHRAATPKRRRACGAELGLTPRAIDREVTEVMHRTHEGVDLDAENILKSALRCSLADGWGGAMLAHRHLRHPLRHAVAAHRPRSTSACSRPTRSTSSSTATSRRSRR